MRKIKFFAFLICILVLFNALPFASCNVLEQDVSNEPPAADAETQNRIQIHRVNDYDRSDRE